MFSQRFYQPVSSARFDSFEKKANVQLHKDVDYGSKTQIWVGGRFYLSDNLVQGFIIYFISPYYLCLIFSTGADSENKAKSTVSCTPPPPRT